ncbi:MAG: hypothetical protein JNN01_12315 [Opitutaceae bacterium]|nr:hypothetical protein [Opitutaceae bacterium]
MSSPLTLRRHWLLWLALLASLPCTPLVRAQPASAGPGPMPATASPYKSAAREELTHAELLEAYYAVRDQLRATQAALLSQRAEADERSRAQTQVLNERLESLKASLAAVNKRQQEDASRAEYELFRQQEQAQRSTQLALWIAASVGLAVLLATFLTAHYQRRAMNRIAEAVTQHPQLLAQANAGLLPFDASLKSDRTVNLSNQRLATTLERIEQRIQDLEHTTHDVTTVPPHHPLAPEPGPRRV